MSTDHTTPTPRADDGVPSELAARLSRAMTAEVESVTTSPDLYERVTERATRRRWTIRVGWLAGAAAVAAGVVVVVSGLPPSDGPLVVPDVVDTPEEQPSSDGTPSGGATQAPDAPTPDGGAQVPTLATRDLGSGVVVPGTQVVVTPDRTGLELVTATADGEVRTPLPFFDVPVATPGPGLVEGVWVRPGSTPDELGVLVAHRPVVDGPVQLHLLVAREGQQPFVQRFGAVDGGEFTPTVVWGPSARAFAVADGQGVRLVQLGGDDGEALVVSDPVADVSAVTQWVDVDDPATEDVELELWGVGQGEAGMVSVPGTIAADGPTLGEVERRLAPDDAEGEVTYLEVATDAGSVLRVYHDGPDAEAVLLTLRSADGELLDSTDTVDAFAPLVRTLRVSAMDEGLVVSYDHAGGQGVSIRVGPDGLTPVARDVTTGPDGLPTPADWVD